MSLDSVKVMEQSNKPNESEKKKKRKKKKKNNVRVKFRVMVCCLPSTTDVDSSSPTLSTTTLGSKSATTVKSNEQPAGPVSSSTTATSNAESSLSTPMISEELKIYSHLKQFSFLDLKLATRNFRPESLLGEGGFGCVFKGWVEENGTAPVKPGTGLTVAVKTLNLDGLQGHKEWLAEINYLGNLLHPNLVKLIELVAPKEVANECPLSSFRFFKTKEVPTGFFEIKTGSLNSRTPWWDSSAIYGSNSKAMDRVRTYKDGKLKLSEETGLLLQDQDGLAISGDVRNSWVGVSALQALFIKEHNAVCDALKKEYDDLEDEDLYRHARLVTSAVIAKIHTIDWTVELLKTDTLLAGMRTNWYGILGKKFKDSFGHVGSSILGGLVGMKKSQNHGVPYSITEDFTSVYRMHSLLPDQLELRDIDVVPGTNKSLPLIEEVSFGKLLGPKGEQTMSHIGFTKLMVSMGHQASGALELMNYPLWLRDLVPHDPNGYDRPDHIDLAALEIYRDRERNVARYNEFRRSMFMIPIKKWEDLTDDKEAIEALEDVYGGNVDELDLLVGLMAEKKIKGFAISETAFNIFVLMATRRLEADRFFTSDFNEMTYTKKGLEWVNTTENLKEVFDRHYPEMTERWMNSESAFSVWDSPPVAKNPIPLYLRVPPS